MKDTGCGIGPISGGCFTAIVAPDGTLLGEPLRSGEGAVIADLDFTRIDKRKGRRILPSVQTLAAMVACLLARGGAGGPGPQGPPGPKGADGVDGTNGLNGQDGLDGQDGGR